MIARRWKRSVPDAVSRVLLSSGPRLLVAAKLRSSVEVGMSFAVEQTGVTKIKF